MRGAFDVDDVILNFDPAAPQHRFREAGLHAAHAAAEAALPQSIPWPAGTAPTPAPLAPAPAETDDLSRFSGYDAVVMTWTSAATDAVVTPISSASTIPPIITSYRGSAVSAIWAAPW